MDMGLVGKVAVVTGASKGIGAAVAAALVAEGAKVVLSSRKLDALEATAATIDGDTAVFAANAGDPDAARACIDFTVERYGRIDILVNNAATNPYFGPALDIDLGALDKTYQVNQRGPVVWAKAAWDASMRDGGGSIVNIASVGGMTVEHGIGQYNVTKAALIHLTKVLASELAPGVRVNAVAPGLVKTDMARALWERDEHRIAARMPLARLGETDDIAAAVTFLAGAQASWITGHTLVVDGGAMVRPSG